MITKLISTISKGFIIRPLPSKVIYQKLITKIRYQFCVNSPPGNQKLQKQQVDTTLNKFMNNRFTLSKEDFVGVLDFILHHKLNIDLTDYRFLALLQSIQHIFEKMNSPQIIQIFYAIIDLNAVQARPSLFQRLSYFINQNFHQFQIPELTKVLSKLNQIASKNKQKQMNDKYIKIYTHFRKILDQNKNSQILIYSQNEIEKGGFYAQRGYFTSNNVLYFSQRSYIRTIKALTYAKHQDIQLIHKFYKFAFNESNHVQNLNKFSLKQIKKLFVNFNKSHLSQKDQIKHWLADILAKQDNFQNDISFGLRFNCLMDFIYFIQQNYAYYQFQMKGEFQLSPQIKKYCIKILQFVYNQKEVVRNSSFILATIMLKIVRTGIIQKNLFNQILDYNIGNYQKSDLNGLTATFRTVAMLHEKDPSFYQQNLQKCIKLVISEYNTMSQLQKYKVSSTARKYKIKFPQNIILVRKNMQKRLFRKQITNIG